MRLRLRIGKKMNIHGTRVTALTKEMHSGLPASATGVAMPAAADSQTSSRLFNWAWDEGVSRVHVNTSECDTREVCEWERGHDRRQEHARVAARSLAEAFVTTFLSDSPTADGRIVPFLVVCYLDHVFVHVQFASSFHVQLSQVGSFSDCDCRTTMPSIALGAC